MPKKLTTEQKLLAHVKKFIKDNQISCAESVHQTDKVIENAYDFIEQCCELVGYYEYPDE